MMVNTPNSKVPISRSSQGKRKPFAYKCVLCFRAANIRTYNFGQNKLKIKLRVWSWRGLLYVRGDSWYIVIDAMRENYWLAILDLGGGEGRGLSVQSSLSVTQATQTRIKLIFHWFIPIFTQMHFKFPTDFRAYHFNRQYFNLVLLQPSTRNFRRVVFLHLCDLTNCGRP